MPSAYIIFVKLCRLHMRKGNFKYETRKPKKTRITKYETIKQIKNYEKI